MVDLLASLGNWNWLILGLVLVGLELLTPGVFLFWLGLAAFLVGALSFALDPAWQTHLLMFAVFAAAAVPLWRRMARRESGAAASPFLNRRAEALVGRVFTLERPIVDGTGIVRIDDTIWRVAGPDAPAGSRVRVVKADGASLTVAAAEP
ncbi:MAG TPA: NfeD family protein [Nitrobacter sp.]|nr:NfeD family protein [Nitrobacter sp.]